jgi:hypothetical protein
MDEEFRDKEKELVAEIPDFDVVLTDMKMPMSKQTLGQGIFQHGVEVPYGFPIVLKAAKAGAKFVAMVTDTNHHQGAMSAAIDHIGGTFTIEGAEVLFVHARFVEDIIPDVDCTECTDGVCPRCNGSLKVMNWENELVTCRCTENNPGKCGKCKGTGKFDDSVWERKDWGEVLNRLIGK